jgi:hypothetical protein
MRDDVAMLRGKFHDAVLRVCDAVKDLRPGRPPSRAGGLEKHRAWHDVEESAIQWVRAMDREAEDAMQKIRAESKRRKNR